MLTIDQHIANTLLAIKLWRKRVKPEDVYPGLEDFSSDCGSLHCFGGHVALWPEFLEQGVYRDSQGGPSVHTSVTDGLFVFGADYLFGEHQLFYIRDNYTMDECIKRLVGREAFNALSDHALVNERLNLHYVRLLLKKMNVTIPEALNY